MAGWIKLHRKMAEWEWYTEPNTFRLFMHLLLHVNHEDKSWRGVKVPAGSILTGRHSLSQKTGLSERQVRTALKNLKSTGEVTSKINNQYSIISIVKWSDYQSSDQQLDQPKTSKRPASDQQATTTKECKNVKNDKEVGFSDNHSGRNVKTYDFSKWPSPPSDNVLDDYKKTRKARLTQTAIDRMAGEIHKAVNAGLTPDDCLSVCCEAGWQGFKYDWYLNREKKNGNSGQNSEGLTGAAKRASDFHDDLKRYAEGGAAAVLDRKNIR